MCSLFSLSLFSPSLLCLSLPGSYVWEHLEMGYVQGMCDLLAPLMVILDDGERKELNYCELTDQSPA